MRFVILHYHILKNAGSTIEEALDWSFGERFARLDSEDRDYTINGAGLLEFVRANPGVEAISSHQTRYPLPDGPEALGILFFDICFVRNPIERVRSMYDYFRRRPAEGDPVSDLANGSDLGGFVAGMVRDFSLQIRNVQVNLIAAEGDSDEPTTADLEVATDRMMEAAMPGVVDMFEESLDAGAHRLRTIFPGIRFAQEPVNVSQQRSGCVREVCEPSVWNELVRMNELDFELVRRVRAEVKRRADVARRAREYQGVALDPAEVFDAEFYLRANPDVRAARVRPLAHYLTHGRQEGRKPHALFQPDYYAAHGVNPHRLFDCAGYVEAHPELAGSGVHPLIHYVRSGERSPGGAMVVDDVAIDFSVPAQQRRFFESISARQLGQ